MILGNGGDIVDNLRIKKAIKNQRFINRIFSKDEIKNSKKMNNKIQFYAKRFAAKEAFLKAIGTGISKGLILRDISVKNNKDGKPMLVINKKIKQYILRKYRIKKFNTHLSLSDENNYSIAFVILNKI